MKSYSAAVSFVVLTIFCLCSNTPALLAQGSVPGTSKIDTITDLNVMQGNEAVWFHDGEYIHIYNIEADDDEEAMEKVGQISGCTESYSGSARGAAKTSYDTVFYTAYSTIGALRSSLAPDAKMQSLGLKSSSGRVSQENLNVNIATVKMYAIKRESDEDYHMVMGSSVSDSALIIAEASGLPSSSSSASYSRILAVRDSIKAYFGTDFCGNSGYTVFSSGINLTYLRGSVLYDINHAPGSTGPSGYRPSTAWEIHPVHDITFKSKTVTGIDNSRYYLASATDNRFKLYPNPASDKIVIEDIQASGNRPDSKISLQDMTGKQLALYITDFNGLFTVPLSNLCNGVYILKFHSGNESFVGKVFINK